MALSGENISNCSRLQKNISEGFQTLIDDTEDLVKSLNSTRVYNAFVTGTDYGNRINQTLEEIRRVANSGLSDVNEKLSASMATYLGRQEQLNERGS